MHLSILLFDRFTALDIVGGYEILARLPGVETELVSTEPGIVAADTRRLGLVSSRRLQDLESTDILYVPGGPGVDAVIEDQSVIGHIARLSGGADWTFGICNGVAILGAAGLIAGRQVTTNWGWRGRVAGYGADVVTERYVRDGTLVTGAGVSASNDAALYLTSQIFGEATAELVRLGIEHYPRPPVGPASVDDVDEQAKDMLRARQQDSEPLQLQLTPPCTADPTSATPRRRLSPTPPPRSLRTSTFCGGTRSSPARSS